MTETDTVAALVERMREAARGVQKLLGDRAPLTMNAASVLSLIAAYEAERERSDCAEQSESELVQGAKDLDLQIEDLRAERDALAELLRRAGEGLTPFVKWSKPERDFADELTDHLVSYGDEMEIDMSDFAGDPANPLLWGDLSRARSILADIEARLPKPTSPPA